MISHSLITLLQLFLRFTTLDTIPFLLIPSSYSAVDLAFVVYVSDSRVSYPKFPLLKGYSHIT